MSEEVKGVWETFVYGGFLTLILVILVVAGILYVCNAWHAWQECLVLQRKRPSVFKGSEEALRLRVSDAVAAIKKGYDAEALRLQLDDARVSISAVWDRNKIPLDTAFQQGFFNTRRDYELAMEYLRQQHVYAWHKVWPPHVVQAICCEIGLKEFTSDPSSKKI